MDPKPAIPWYQSPVQIAQTASAISTIVTLFPKVGFLQALGLTDPGVVNGYVTSVFGVVALGAAVAGMLLRAKSKVQPLTLTQAKADNHPQTIAANK